MIPEVPNFTRLLVVKVRTMPHGLLTKLCSLLTVFMLPAPLNMLALAPCSLVSKRAFSLLPDYPYQGGGLAKSHMTLTHFSAPPVFWVFTVGQRNYFTIFFSTSPQFHIIISGFKVRNSYGKVRSGSLPKILNYLPDRGQFSRVPVLIQIHIELQKFTWCAWPKKYTLSGR